jgi:dihydrofolate synthase/folylpolyglutamate synthase
VNYREALAWLYTTQLHGVKPGLECMQRLVRELALPVDGTHGPRFIHVAGTNGKGSVCAMLESILRASGVRTGLFTSPHLIHFRERIQVAGVEIDEDSVAEGLTRIRSLSEAWERPPTFFEITTALGLLHFQKARVEIAVMETGLGGRLDATNVVMPLISVLTPIDIDHEQFLGRRLAEIALEKAGIIKPGRPAISGPQPEEVQQVLAHVALDRDSQFHLVLSPLAGVPLALSGDYQRWNAALAVHSLDAAGLTVSNHALIRGLATVRWPGRFQRLEHDQIILDGAHNLAAARQLSRTWAEMYGEEKATVIVGIMQDKDVRGICAALAPLAKRFIAVRVRNTRSASAEDVLAAILELGPCCESFAAENLDDALDIAEGCTERILITGSLFLVGEALALLQGERELEASLQ